MGPEGIAKYKEYMKEHEADWYKSDEFRDMFTKCPPGAIMWVARAFFGDGNTVKAGVNLSDRTIECLEWAENELGKEQYTMPYATEIAITIKYLKARKEKLAEEAETKKEPTVFMEPPKRMHPVVYRMCIHLTKETNMQVPFKDKKEYLKVELKKLEGFEMGWVMKEYDDAENGNAVSLYGLDKGQAFGISNKGTRATVALQSCYVVEYMFNETSNTVVFTDDDLEGAIDYTLKLIALAKA